ncbi:MAG: hypothetical protein AAF709_06205 [Pseudomonadota bacterium]
MNACGHPGITCAAAIALMLLSGFEQSDAATPERATTAAQVKALMVRIEERRRRSAQTGLMPVPDVDGSLANWRPWRTRRDVKVKIQRMRRAPQAIPRLIANAICRQDAASLHTAQRLDALLDGQLFNRHEAMIANEIARQRQLDISFQPRPLPIGDQALKDINRTRRINQALRKLGPDAAVELVSSLQRLCRAVSTD